MGYYYDGEYIEENEGGEEIDLDDMPFDYDAEEARSQRDELYRITREISQEEGQLGY